MKNQTNFFMNHLSTLILIIIYTATVILHIISDSFLLEDQIAILLVMIPFIIYGVVIDYLSNRNLRMKKSYQIISKLLPSGIFIMQYISTFLLYQDINTLTLFQYLLWLFLALPLYIISFDKQELRKRTLRSIIGLAPIFAVYLYMTTQTDNLSIGFSAVIYFFTYFFLLYTASGLMKIPYTGIILGIVNAIALLLARYVPASGTSSSFAWDYNLVMNTEILLFITLILSIIFRIIEEFEQRTHHKEKLS